MNFRDTLKINALGHVEIGGKDVKELAEKFGTPLYVLDLNYIEKIIDVFTQTIQSEYGNGKMLYASKALSTTALYTFVGKTDAGCDVVSGGELFTALKGGFPADKIYMHGNNIQRDEVEFALDSKIHAIVLDGFDGIDLVQKIAKEKNVTANVMLRLNPGISAHTHEFVQTACDDSKFGLSTKNGSAFEAIEKILSSSNLNLIGVHTHIGSQIFEHEAYVVTAKVITDFLKELKDKLNLELPELNMGGGFGIYYEGEDKKFTVQTYADHLKALLVALNIELSSKGLQKPYVVVEPGRAIVGEAGITLYTVGAVKDIPNIRKYVSIDGGLFDNPRYALYGSRYSCSAALKANEPSNSLITLAGKCCESGDLICKDVYTQELHVGDLVCVFSTGAYNYSMASNYNRNFVPPMVAIYKDECDYIVKPQTYEDLTRNDVVPKFIK